MSDYVATVKLYIGTGETTRDVYFSDPDTEDEYLIAEAMRRAARGCPFPPHYHQSGKVIERREVRL